MSEGMNGNARSKILFVTTLMLVLLAIGWFVLWFFYFRFHQRTDDAYANGNLVNINGATPGSVVAFFADDTDLVQEGQLLVLLDSTAYQIQYETALATLGATVLQVKELYDQERAAAATVAAARILFGKAQYDYENRKKLEESQAIAKEEIVHAGDDLLIAEFNLKRSEALWEAARDAIGGGPIANHPRIEEQKGRVRDAYYLLAHCRIYAPTTGFVAKRAVEVGQWISHAENLMAVIPMDYLWVDANYKETQLRRMRIGQSAEVSFDLYGSSVKYKGKVLGIGSGTGSVFSIIPPQNATGNWIKIVQRLPVRISLDPEQVRKYPPRLGISARVNVDITEQNLPRLAQSPHTRPIAKTKVFELDFKEAEERLEKVIRENLSTYE